MLGTLVGGRVSVALAALAAARSALTIAVRYAERPAARGLVDAFAIPDAMLGAPIAIETE